MEELGTGYVDTRNDLVNAVTLQDLKRVGKRMFESQELMVTVVGKPKGVTPGG